MNQKLLEIANNKSSLDEIIKKAREEYERLMIYTEQVPDFPDYAEVAYYQQVWINIPWNEEYLEEMRDILNCADFKKGITWGDRNQGEYSEEFKKSIPGVPFQICINITARANRQGSTCELVQIGTKTEIKEVPIFELKCLHQMEFEEEIQQQVEE